MRWNGPLGWCKFTRMAAATTTTLRLPEGASPFTRLRLAVRALNILKDEPGHVEAGPLLNMCLDREVYVSIAAELRRSEEGRRLLAEKPSLQGPELDLAALERLDEGTFGRAVARYFRSNDLEPFVTTFPIESDVDYISKRYRETHDFAHVVTGYGTDVMGEMELQSFMGGNLGIRSPWLIVTFATLLDPMADDPVGPRGPYLRRLRRAYRRGRRSPSLLRVPYEDHWATPLETVRAALVAPPAPYCATA